MRILLVDTEALGLDFALRCAAAGHDVRWFRWSKKPLRDGEGFKGMVNLDPANEAACRALMQARAELGDVAGALRAYDGLQKLLRAEHQVPPADATISLWEAIKRGAFDPAPDIEVPDSLSSARQLRVSDRDAPPRGAGRGQGSGRIGVLVQGFERSGVSEDRFALIESFRHDLVGCLVRFREWAIIDGTALPSGDAAAAARYVLDATAYANGDAIVLVLTLRDQIANVYIWSDRHEIRFADWFATQERIVRQVAVSLRFQVALERLDSLRANPDAPREAYDFWLLGQSLLPRYSASHWNRAVSLFEAALRSAPGFSPAYSSLVQMNHMLHIVHPGMMRDPAKLAVTLQTALRAVALDPRDSRALVGLGWTLALQKQFEDAAVHMHAALERNSNDAWTLLGVALFEAYCGQSARAQALARQSFALSPAPSASNWARMGLILYFAGDDAGALAALDHAPDGTAILPAWRAAALYQLGRHEAARVEAGRSMARVRANWFGAEPPTDAAIGRWMLHLLPLGRPELWERLRAGFAGAGIPTGGLRFNEW